MKIEGLDKYFDRTRGQSWCRPEEKVSEFKGGKKKIVERKLYPGYLVVHMEINDETWFAGSRDVRHRRLHRRGRQAVADAAARSGPDRARREEEESDEAPKLDIKFKVGDRVKIKEGTFENFEGEVGRHRRGQSGKSHGDDQHLRPQYAGRIGILANRRRFNRVTRSSPQR